MDPEMAERIEQLGIAEVRECELLLVRLNRQLFRVVLNSPLPARDSVMTLKEAVLYLSLRGYHNKLDDMFSGLVDSAVQRTKVQLEAPSNMTLDQMMAKLNLLWSILRLKIGVLYDVSLHWVRYMQPYCSSLTQMQVNVQPLSMQKFSQIVFGSSYIKTRVCSWLIERFEQRRKGTNLETTDLYQILDILQQCSHRTYERVFEEAFLDSSIVFYQEKYDKWLEEDGADDNFTVVMDAAIENEVQTVCRDLPASTKVKLVARLTSRFM